MTFFLLSTHCVFYCCFPCIEVWVVWFVLIKNYTEWELNLKRATAKKQQHNCFCIVVVFRWVQVLCVVHWRESVDVYKFIWVSMNTLVCCVFCIWQVHLNECIEKHKNIEHSEWNTWKSDEKITFSHTHTYTAHPSNSYTCIYTRIQQQSRQNE